jgi:hypothetical protein
VLVVPGDDISFDVIPDAVPVGPDEVRLGLDEQPHAVGVAYVECAGDVGSDVIPCHNVVLRGLNSNAGTEVARERVALQIIRNTVGVGADEIELRMIENDDPIGVANGDGPGSICADKVSGNDVPVGTHVANIDTPPAVAREDIPFVLVVHAVAIRADDIGRTATEQPDAVLRVAAGFTTGLVGADVVSEEVIVLAAVHPDAGSVETANVQPGDNVAAGADSEPIEGTSISAGLKDHFRAEQVDVATICCLCSSVDRDAAVQQVRQL